jgi:hypothetical protein
VCLGEHATEILVCRFSHNSSLFQPDIIVIGKATVRWARGALRGCCMAQLGGQGSGPTSS